MRSLFLVFTAAIASALLAGCAAAPHLVASTKAVLYDSPISRLSVGVQGSGGWSSSATYGQSPVTAMCIGSAVAKVQKALADGLAADFAAKGIPADAILLSKEANPSPRRTHPVTC